MRVRRSATDWSSPGETTAAAVPAAANPTHAELLLLQRTAGNQAVNSLIVQRATAPQIATAKEAAGADFDAGRVAPYFSGNFLANHIEPASDDAQKAAEKKSTSTKSARGQAYKKLEERADVEDGGSGWGPGKKMTGTNTLILDYGVQQKQLMSSVNIAAIDSSDDHPYLHPVTDERMKTVTYSSSGEKSEKTGKIETGAKFEDGRYKINHLGKVL